MDIKTYLLILGIKKVSGYMYMQYTGIKIIRGTTLDNAFNREHLNSPMVDGMIVMEAYVLDTSIETSDGTYCTIERIV